MEQIKFSTLINQPKKVNAFFVYGFIIGSFFPVALFLIEYFRPGPFLKFFHQDHAYILFMILSAPVILGFTFRYIGLREAQLDRLNATLKTEVHKQTREIQEQYLYFKALIDNSPNAVVVLDQNQRIESCNQTFRDMFGYRDDELIGNYIDALIVPRDGQESAISLTQTVQVGGKIERTATRIKKSGEEITVLVKGVPIFIDGKQIGILAIYADISLQEMIKQELDRARVEAENIAQAKSEFLSNMSHEIRTPLNAIVGMAGLMMDTQLDAEQRDYLHTIRNGSDALLSIIDDILDFSKIDAGKLELEMHPFYVRDCIESALDLLVPKAAEKGLELAYLASDDLPAVILGDVTRLRQVLVNLIGNAVKFTDSGEVVVNAGVISREDDQCKLIFSVEDTGIGIPEDRIERLFQSFSQVDSSTTRKYGGTGLGLSISKKLVGLMGGEINVESTPGVGTKFSFTIAAKVGVSDVPRIAPSGVRRLEGKRVLLVDDLETNRLILTKQTSRWGMIPVPASSAAEALNLLSLGDNFDLAIIDMMMPKMDGVTLAKEIRKLPARSDIPLIMLTSIGRERNSGEYQIFDAFLSKPIKPDVLFTSIYAVLIKEDIDTPRKPAKSLFDATLAENYPMTILLAEDNLINQKVARGIFGKLGYQIEIVSSGVEVLDALERQKYDTVFMDIQMPEMDGETATKLIWNRYPAGQRPVIIAMTAHALAEDRLKYLDAGMDGYVSKPIKVENLVEEIIRTYKKEKQ